MKYRKRPVVISAIRWSGNNTVEVIDWILDGGCDAARWHDADATNAAQFIAIDTLEGTMRADPGDWVIRGIQNEHYPCKPGIFKATYEAVERRRPVRRFWEALLLLGCLLAGLSIVFIVVVFVGSTPN